MMQKLPESDDLKRQGPTDIIAVCRGHGSGNLAPVTPYMFHGFGFHQGFGVFGPPLALCDQ